MKDRVRSRLTCSLGALLVVILAGALARPSCASSGVTQAPRIEVGQEAPTVALATPDGTRLRASDLRDEKRLVLVFFRGTW